MDKGLTGGRLEDESTQRQCCSRTLSGCHERLSDGHESFDVFRLRIKAVVSDWASSQLATETTAILTTIDTIRVIAAPTTLPTLVRHDDDRLRGQIARLGKATAQKIHQGRTTNAADHAAMFQHFQLGRVFLNATATFSRSLEIIAVEINHVDAVAVLSAKRNQLPHLAHDAASRSDATTKGAVGVIVSALNRTSDDFK
jgi:hypothetical protein